VSTVRHRVRFKDVIAGEAKYSFQDPYQGSYRERQENMRDVTNKKVRKTKNDPLKGTLPPSDLIINRSHVTVPPTVSFSQYTSEYLRNWPGTHNLGYFDPPVPVDGFGDLGYAEVTTALSRTNPFRYGVSVPVMVAEILEMAHLFKFVTRSYASLLGSGHLSLEFGAAPFVSDIQSLSNIVKHIHSRVREYNSLIEKGSVRRKVPISNSSYSVFPFGGDSDQEIPLYTGMSVSFWAKNAATWSQKTWASCTWTVRNGAKLPVTELNDFLSATKYFLDLDQGFLNDRNSKSLVDWATLWEAIPFSWLIDYFVNVGDTLQAIEQDGSVMPRDICIMRHRKVEYRLVPQIREWFAERKMSATPGLETHEILERRVFPDDPGLSELLSFGFMNDNQAKNVLALLAVMTAKRKG
jgi:hypothetical protein